MKNIAQIKSLIIGCCCQNCIEIPIIVYNEKGYKYWWNRINTVDNNITVIDTACIYPDYHIAFNLSHTDVISIKIYFLAGLKIQTCFNNDSVTLSIISLYEDEEY